jgi:MFS family permease
VAGARVALGSRTVRVLGTFLLITSFGEGIWGTLFAPYVRSVLHGGPEALGVISGIQAVGGVVGSLVVAAFGSRWQPQLMLGFGALAFGLVDLAIALYPLGYVHAWPAAVLMVVVGLPGAIVTAGMMTLFQQHTDDRERGRVFALLLLVRSTSTVLGSLTAGLLGGALGIVPVLAWQGCGYMLAGLLAVLLLVRGPGRGRHEPAAGQRPRYQRLTRARVSARDSTNGSFWSYSQGRPIHRNASAYCWARATVCWGRPHAGSAKS